MIWNQNYDPLGNAVLSTLCAALPVVVLLAALAFFHVRAELAAALALISGVGIASFVFGMPVGMAVKAVGFGIVSGMFPIGWIVLNILFLYRLTTLNGSFTILQNSVGLVTTDRRLQLLLVAFCFGAFFEGAAGFGTPVAVSGAALIGLGFSPLAASGLALIANTAPVAFGALGAPVIGLASVTGLDLLKLSAMIGRQLPFFSVLVPFWLIWAFAGFSGMIEIWPAVLVAGASFAIPQYLISNFHGPWLVDVVSSLVSMGCLTAFLRVWRPKRIWTSTALRNHFDNSKVEGSIENPVLPVGISKLQAWLPWIILSIFAFVWGVPEVKKLLDGIWVWKWPIPGLDKLVQKMPPVVAKPLFEPAVFNFTILSMAGTGILISALISGFIMKYSLATLMKEYGKTIWAVRTSLATICLMFAVGYITRFAGLDATLGLAFAHTGVFYPLFGTLLGWLGVALTGSDTASNALFGGLQKTTAEQLGLSPILMGAANSSGGVMGKMIDAQSIVVASTATKWYGHEGDILRYVFFHSIALAVLVGLFITLQAYVAPFTAMVVK